jgi:hypothetical protein
MNTKIQFNYNGQFRIMLQDGMEVYYGDWADYCALAVLQHQGKTYIAGSEYGLLPQGETIYEIAARPTTLDQSMQYIDARGKDHREECEKLSGPPTSSLNSL